MALDRADRAADRHLGDLFLPVVEGPINSSAWTEQEGQAGLIHASEGTKHARPKTE